MKKCKVLIYTLAVTFILSMFQQVNAALADNAIDAENTMLKPNEIVMRNNYDVNVPNLLPGEVGFCQGVANRGLEKDVNDDKDNVLRFRRYEMYDVTSSNASVTRRYGNIGYVNSGEYKGYTLGADMTISDLKMGNGSVNYDYSPTDRGADAGIGFNKYYLGFILFEGSTIGYGDIARGSVAKITVRYFLADGNGNPLQYNTDGTVKYFNASSAYMGIGGFSSEKKTSGNVLGAPQWEYL